NNADLYINGVKQTISKITPPRGTQTSNEGEGIIGNHIPLNRGWDGLIDELRIYNRALSAAEIVSLYDQGNNASFNFSLSNSMSLEHPRGNPNPRLPRRVLFLDPRSLFLSRHQGSPKEAVPLLHRNLAPHPVPACLRSPLPPLAPLAPPRSL